ncbi:MAG: thiamine pyrophosphate-binding protein [Desulfobulbaceae bacterium]
MKVTGAQAIIKCLKEQGVEVIFGFPGGAVIDLYDELEKSDITHVLVRHEQAAVHAADAYGRVKGDVGVALVTSGPGATNTVTGIASAYMDSIPLVVFTGQVPTALIGNDAFQEVDIVGITRPCTKHNYLVKDANELVSIIREAFYIARTGRPGPVLIDLPKDVVNSKINFEEPTPIKMQTYRPTYEPHPGQIAKACKEILKAKKPVVYAGGGVIASNSNEDLTELATKLNMPVTMTLMGLGGFPGTHKLSMGMLGMHGTYYANMAVSQCDLLIAIGARFDDRVTGKLEEFAPYAKIIHIDIDAAEIGKNNNLDYMEGPVGFSNLDKVGVLVEGFNDMGTMITWYNYPYYKDHYEHHGFEKEKEYMENRFPASNTKPEHFIKIQALIKKRYGLKAMNFTKSADIMPWADQMFDLFNFQAI